MCVISSHCEDAFVANIGGKLASMSGVRGAESGEGDRGRRSGCIRAQNGLKEGKKAHEVRCAYRSGRDPVIGRGAADQQTGGHHR